jgi:hypothetical protein
MRPKKKIDRRKKNSREMASWVGLVGLVGPAGSVLSFFFVLKLFLISVL